MSHDMLLYDSPHWKKYRNFTWFPGVEILQKGTVSAQFRAIRPKLCGNCAFPQNFHTRKSGEITVFFAVPGSIKPMITETYFKILFFLLVFCFIVYLLIKYASSINSYIFHQYFQIRNVFKNPPNICDGAFFQK